MHPSTASLLSFFDYSHLPPDLAEMSRPFCELATSLANRADLDGPEVTAGLRKLLEAKDCAVRALVAAKRRAG